jgi:uncharacterized protein YjhX (UPF0386 family)
MVEASIGRKLNKEEVVHHKDGNPYNFDIGNLQMIDAESHNRWHHGVSRLQIYKRLRKNRKEIINLLRRAAISRP